MNLENLGVQEMSAKELKEVEGGLLGVLLAVAIILLTAKSAS